KGIMLRSFAILFTSFLGMSLGQGGLFPTESHEYEVFRFALSHHQEIPKLVPQVDMVKMGNSFSMTYACKCSVDTGFGCAFVSLYCLTLKTPARVRALGHHG
uniref:Uncharacterized protein n=1 Tax=Periophthalmus magnuspinnatus TaxID=409849 RepID=A0A3B4A4V9_9GOBI